MGQLICGRNSVLEAVKNNLKIKWILTTKPHEIKNVEIVVKKVSKDFLNKLTKENHQGFVAVLQEFNYFSLDIIFKSLPSKILVLDHLQDPRNLGAILRTANAAGITFVIIPKKRAAQVTTATIKVASGGCVGLKVIRVDSIVDTIIKLKKANFWIYATSFKNAENYKEINYNFPLVLVVGAEHKGVTRSVLKHADKHICIPTEGTVQSLNVAVATGILLFNI